MVNYGGVPNLIVKDLRGLRPPGVTSHKKRIGQVQGYVISSVTFYDTEMTLPCWFLGYHGTIPVNEQGSRERYKCNEGIGN